MLRVASTKSKRLHPGDTEHWSSTKLTLWLTLWWPNWYWQCVCWISWHGLQRGIKLLQPQIVSSVIMTLALLRDSHCTHWWWGPLNLAFGVKGCGYQQLWVHKSYLVLELAGYVHYYVLQTPFSHHLICEYVEFPRYHIPPPRSPVLLGMYRITRPHSLRIEGHNLFLTLIWVNKPVFCLACLRNLIFYENLECRTMSLYFLFKTDHCLTQQVLHLVVRMPVIPCLLCLNAFWVKIPWALFKCDSSHILNWIRVKSLKNTLWLVSVPREDAHTSTVLKPDTA